MATFFLDGFFQLLALEPFHLDYLIAFLLDPFQLLLQQTTVLALSIELQSDFLQLLLFLGTIGLKSQLGFFLVH
jgi:hypothetical protein